MHPGGAAALARASTAACAQVAAAALLVVSACTDPVHAVLPPDASGTWAITEVRGGQKCTANLMLQPSRLAQSAADLNRGAARYQGVCVDSASGSWVIQEGMGDEAPARLAWRLDYEKSAVFFAFDVRESTTDRALGGSGEIYASPRGDASAVRRIGSFEARRISREWSLQDPVIARRVTDTVVPARDESVGAMLYR